MRTSTGMPRATRCHTGLTRHISVERQKSRLVPVTPATMSARPSARARRPASRPWSTPRRGRGRPVVSRPPRTAGRRARRTRSVGCVGSPWPSLALLRRRMSGGGVTGGSRPSLPDTRMRPVQASTSSCHLGVSRRHHDWRRQPNPDRRGACCCSVPCWFSRPASPGRRARHLEAAEQLGVECDDDGRGRHQDRSDGDREDEPDRGQHARCQRERDDVVAGGPP